MKNFQASILAIFNKIRYLRNPEQRPVEIYGEKAQVMFRGTERQCEDCYYCGIRHPHTQWKMKDHPEKKVGELRFIWLCGEWYKSGLSMERIMDNLSPSEVLSGVHRGGEHQDVFAKEKNVDFGKNHVEAVKELADTFGEL